ncbi:tripartite tricarboxylate transporter substrate binding protein [Pasteurellaceae bacterium HPA106]|uniref:Bug family tripartite tricarboxylate transporter substrate binding protein n=1 Tax=Spirabiliibacterium pneumoniae TaxID=221400 RepID=UPI001AAD1322|nr:tripartite tricarboxylate transporter substrate-binding protein [Spirabiliibacterium pneumoniae]MBE2895334.1 tripartite tricarboxylate transporter substrate binding protein [Spirabiliibacterium pneumoniae]
MKKFASVVLLGLFASSSFAAPTIKECLAPAGPGGGWDFTCRSVSKLLFEEKLVPNPIQTVNMAGAGGGVAFAHVVSKRKKDDGLFVAASTATTTRLAQGQFKGMNADMVKWVAAIGADYGVIAVKKDAPYQTLDDLMAALKKTPSAVKFAGASSVGGWDHLKVLMAAQEAGVKNAQDIRYLSFNNGGDAITKVLGGHLDAFTGDISEAQGFIQSGDLRVLAVLADERLPAPYDAIPTAKEQGINTTAANWRGFYLPKEVSDETYNWWVTTLDKLNDDPKWHAVMAQNGLMPFHKSGAAFTDYVNTQIADIQAISKSLGIIK